MNEKSFEGYFQNELSKIRELAKEFSIEHPAVAPLLNAHNADPDAQRLLEGVAFLTALLNQKLDDEFPEVIHGLMNILFMFSFSRQNFSVKAIFTASIVNLLIGVILSRMFGLEYAIYGLLFGSIVFLGN